MPHLAQLLPDLHAKAIASPERRRKELGIPTTAVAWKLPQAPQLASLRALLLR